MKLFDAIRNVLNTEQRAADPSWNALAGGGTVSESGQRVDSRTAESIAAVYACVAALSESTSTLPLHVYMRGEDGNRARVDDHALARVLREPNSYSSGLAFRESMTASVLLEGNAIARKEFNAAGELVALHPMNWRGVSVVKLPNGRHRFDCTNDDGSVSRLLQDEVFHLADRTDAGSIIGKSRIAIARDTLGLAITLRKHGAGIFGRGARPAAIITNEGQRDLTTEQLRGMQDELAKYSQPENAGRSLILPRHMKYQSVGLSNEDVQWLAAQQFGVAEVARIYRVPPILIQELTHATFTNTIELGAQFVRFSLARWISMWEQEIGRQLLGPIARRRYYAAHSVEGLLRGDSAARADFYGKGIKDGWLDVEEVRQLEDLPARRVASGDA